MEPDGIPFHEWSPDELDRIRQWIKEKWGQGKQCPMCNTSAWSILNIQISLPGGSHSQTPNIKGSHWYPNAGILCRNCGATFFINSGVGGFRIAESGSEGHS